MEAPVYSPTGDGILYGQMGPLVLGLQVLCHKESALMARLDVAMRSWQDFLQSCVQRAFARTQVELNCSTADA